MSVREQQNYKNNEDMGEKLLKLEKSFKKAVTYFYAPLPEEAYQMFQEIISMDPNYINGEGDSPYFYLGRTLEYYWGDFETAKEYYTKAVELCPDDSESYECRGICWLREDRYELALSDFRKATELIKTYGYAEIYPDLDDIIIEIENRLGGGKPNKEYDDLFNCSV